MVAARSAREISGFGWDELVMSVDWVRVLLEAEAEHDRHVTWGTGDGERSTCGWCVRGVLLRREDWL